MTTFYLGDIFDDLFFRDYDEVFLNKGGEGVWGSYTSKNVFLATNDKKKTIFFSVKSIDDTRY